MLLGQAGKCECYQHDSKAFDRLVLFLPLTAAMFISFGFVLMANSFIAALLATIVCYTALIGIMTFSAYRGQQPFFFTCPQVKSVLPTLCARLGAYLATVVLLEIAAFVIRPQLSLAWVLARSKTPSVFGGALFFLCIMLAFIQVFTNRLMLSRRHHKSVLPLT